jgi:hypothetical protein
VGLDLGQSQIGDVTEQRFDAFVFGDPLLDLGEQILGDVDGAGFALHFKGQVVGQVALPRLAVAAGASAFSAKSDEAGGDKRAFQGEILEAGLQVAADQGGVFWDFHRRWRITDQSAGITETYTNVSALASKTLLAKKSFQKPSGSNERK